MLEGTVWNKSPCPRCWQPTAVAVSNCPHCQAEFSDAAKEERRAIHRRSSLIAFVLLAMVGLLVWWGAM